MRIVLITLIKATNWQLSCTNFPVFKIKICGTFQTLFARKLGLAHPYFLYKNESPQHYLSYYMKQMTTF